MKNILKFAITGAVMYISLFFLGITISKAQCPVGTSVTNDMYCPGIDPNTGLPYDQYAGWDWENTNPFSSTYCKMWNARVDNGTNLLQLKSPFVEPTGNKLNAIRDNNDFTKARGWDILKRDFGCLGVNANPYFILYNKYNSLMRVYMYISNTGGNNYSGIVMTVKPNNVKRTSLTAAARSELLSPDKYFNNTYPTDDETMVYVGDYNGVGKWIVGEFLMTFDPSFNAASFTDNSFDISLYGVQNSTINANIFGTGKTEAYGFNVAPSQVTTVNGVTTLIANGQKAVGFLNSAADGIKKINDGAQKVSAALATTTNSFLKTFQASAANVAALTADIATAVPIIGSVASAIKAGISIIKFAGKLTGDIASKNEEPTMPAVTPTITTFDLKLSGEITSKLVVSTVTLKVPATVHTNNSNLTYYGCPLGIFNINKTPVLEYIGYNRLSHKALNTIELFPDNFSGMNYTYESYKSYRVTSNDLVGLLNSSSGLEIVSVQAAIMGEIDPNAKYDPFSPHIHAQPNYSNGIHPFYDYNFNYMLSQFETGELEVAFYDTDNGLHVFQTPYTDLNRFYGMTFNVRAETKVYVRIKAIMKISGASDDATPVFYIKDYEVDLTAGTNPSNPSYATAAFKTMPPYANYSEPVSTTSPNTVATTSYPIPFTPQYYTVFGGGCAGMLNQSSIPQQSGLVEEGTVSVTTSGTVTISHANSYAVNTCSTAATPTNDPFIFRANRYVLLQPGFTANLGCNFIATLDHGFRFPAAGPVNWQTQNVSCNYNTNALRVNLDNSFDSEMDKDLKSYPNPVSERLNFEIILPNDSDVKIRLLDMLGKEIFLAYEGYVEKGVFNYSINVNDLAGGMYICSYEIAGQKVSERIFIIK